MSKIIKARFVLTENSLNQPKPQAFAKHSEIETVHEPNVLTLKTAEEIYAETKMMMEEIVSEAQREADNILLLAKAQAHKLLEDAETEAAKLKEKAAKDGHEQGVVKGKEESKKNSDAILEQTAKLLGKIDKERTGLYKKYEEVILELTFSLTRKIIGSALEIRPEIISEIIKNILKEVKEAERIMVKVNPVHLPYLGTDAVRLTEKQDNIQFLEDTSLKPGDFILLTETGFVEYKIDEQLDVLKAALLDVTNDA